MMELNNSICKGGCGIDGGELTATIPLELCAERVECEISEDFTVPEYLPEIRRLLRVTPTVTSPEKYLSADSLSLSGRVEYCVLYVGEDGRMHAAFFNDDYEMSVPFGRAYDGIPRSFVSISADGIVTRVTGARRLNVRCRLGSDTRIVGERRVECPPMAREPHMQLLTKTGEYTVELFGEGVESEAVDELELSDRERYVCTYCNVCVDGAVASVGYAECRGSVIMRHLIEREGGRPYEIVRKIPFAELVEVDGMIGGVPLVAFGECLLITREVAEREGEDDAERITVKAQMRLCVRGYKKQSLRYVKDAFSTELECEAETEDITLERVIACAHRNMTVSESREIADASGLEVCNVTVKAEVDGVGLSASGKYTVNGDCRFSIVYRKRSDDTEGESGEYGSLELEIPFKYECSEGGAIPDGTNICVEAIDPRVRMDGDVADLGCELMISYGFCGCETVSAVCDIALGEKLAGMKSGYTVYYPKARDTLWSVSKMYASSVEATAKSNGMDASVEADMLGLTEKTRYMIV